MNAYTGYFVIHPALDPDGTQIELFMPATPEKCADVAYYVTAAAEASRWFSYNKILWDYFQNGNGKPLQIPMSAFDTIGCAMELGKKLDGRGTMLKEVAGSLACGESKTRSGLVSASCKSSGTPMINMFTMSLSWSITITRNCHFGCCTSFSIEEENSRRAFDRTDFNNGDAFTVPAPWGESVHISDDLVNACGLGKPFEVFATSTESHSGSQGCSIRDWEWNIFAD